MKRFIAILMILVTLPACQAKPPAQGGGLNIVCTAYPQYDWTRQILGDALSDVSLSYLLNTGADMHNYQATVEDIIKISNCDMFIYIGGESEAWVQSVLNEAANENMAIINLMEVLGDNMKKAEIKEGMETEHEDEAEHEDEFDEHVWLSLKNARCLSSAIKEKLCMIDPDNAAKYESNLKAYDEKLAALDLEYQEMADAAPVKTLLFGDRFPFRYLLDDYGLDYYAAFPGCSAETEASFNTIVFLAGKMDELNLSSVMVTENASKSIAETIIENTAGKDRRILVMKDMQSVTREESLATYLSAMEYNLGVLREALR